MSWSIHPAWATRAGAHFIQRDSGCRGTRRGPEIDLGTCGTFWNTRDKSRKTARGAFLTLYHHRSKKRLSAGFSFLSLTMSFSFLESRRKSHTVPTSDRRLSTRVSFTRILSANKSAGSGSLCETTDRFRSGASTLETTRICLCETTNRFRSAASSVRTTEGMTEKKN